VGEGDVKLVLYKKVGNLIFIHIILHIHFVLLGLFSIFDLYQLNQILVLGGITTRHGQGSMNKCCLLGNSQRMIYM